MGLRLVLQSRPLCPAFYAISVRRLGILPAASFGFRLTTDTLAFGYDLPAAGRSRDFHPLECALAGRTIKTGADRNAVRVCSVCVPGMSQF